VATLDTMELTPRTATIDITVPESIRACIEAEIARGGYKSVSEYLCDLVRHAMEDTPQRKLETLLLEGLDSGPGEEVTPEMWERMRKDLIARHSEQKPR
jgi:antitoxin ParD1/3/4